MDLELVAGSGISFDESVAGQLKIVAPTQSGGGLNKNSGMIAAYPSGLPSGAIVDQTVCRPTYSNQFHTANFIHAFPVCFASDTRISSLGINLTQAVASDIYFGIYETGDNGRLPTNLLAASGAISTGGTTGHKAWNVDFTFLAGKLYYISYNPSAAHSVACITTGAPNLSLSSATATVTDSGVMASRTAAPAPATFPGTARTNVVPPSFRFVIF